MLEFCSRKTEYKTPFGALATGQTAVFRLRYDVPCKTIHFVWQKDGAAEQVVCMTPNENGWYEVSISFDEIGLYFYRFEIVGTDGRYLFVGRGDNAEAIIGDWLPRWKLTVYDAAFTTPEKYKGKIMYQIFPDRFARVSEQPPSAVTPERRFFHTDPSDIPYDYSDPSRPGGRDYFGGSIAGVREKLPYLQQLGVSIIYFNPIFQSAENHRYSTADYHKIDPYFGTEAEFESFCRQAEQYGISVILDGVFSHTGADSVYFNKENHYESIGAYNSPLSPYYSWYQFEKYPDTYTGWWGFQNLPNVNETDAGYLDFITGKDGVLAHWQRCGADGWRLDVADELPDAFIEALRKRVKSENPEALIIGEVWEHAVEKISYGARRQFLLGRQCDGVMNYPWRIAIIQFVKSGNVSNFAEALQTILEAYPRPALDVMMNILSTHDTRRILTEISGEEVPKSMQSGFRLSPKQRLDALQKVRLCALLQFTLPGIPCIYYGDEIGMEGFADPYCRAFFDWSESENALHSFYVKLGTLRQQFCTDFADGFRLIQKDNGILRFARGKNMEVVVNMGETPLPVKDVLLSTAQNDILEKGQGCIRKRV